MIERSISFGARGGLIGTLCLPEPETAAAGLGQILFNAGVLHRVGPHRLNVRLARQLARRGIPSLRFDLSGLGDSARAAGDASYEKQAVIDLQAAMDELGRAANVQRFALLGFCSGGRASFAAAPVDERIAGIVLYDTYAYATWRSRLNRYRLLARRHGLLASVGGRVGRMVMAASNTVRRWLGLQVAQPAEDAPTNRDPSKAEYVARLRSLCDRGVKVGVVYSGEGINYNYREQFTDSLRGLGIAERIAFAYMPQMDHSAMALSLQAEFIEWLQRWAVELDAQCRRAAGGPVAEPH